MFAVPKAFKILTHNPHPFRIRIPNINRLNKPSQYRNHKEITEKRLIQGTIQKITLTHCLQFYAKLIRVPDPRNSSSTLNPRSHQETKNSHQIPINYTHDFYSGDRTEEPLSPTPNTRKKSVPFVHQIENAENQIA